MQKPMRDSFRDLQDRNPTRQFTEELLKAGLVQVFQGLDYLHSERKIIHTGRKYSTRGLEKSELFSLTPCFSLSLSLPDIKADNILTGIEDRSILDTFVKAELEQPSPRKFVNNLPVYASRRFERPKIFGDVVLSDFGSAVRGDIRRNHDAQPDVYRSPEVMLKIDWSYPIDIWNVGVMVCLILYN